MIKGTALLMIEGKTVKVLENIDRTFYKELSNKNYFYHDGNYIPVHSIVWREDAIDWEYGY